MQIASEGQQLRRKYEGSIRLAACSQQTDWRNIWEEIGPKVRGPQRSPWRSGEARLSEVYDHMVEGTGIQLQNTRFLMCVFLILEHQYEGDQATRPE